MLMVKVLPVMVVAPAPDNVMMEAPLVVALISKVPALATALELAIAPEPESAKVPPLLMVVTPV